MVKKVDAKKPETKKPETKKPETKKSEAKKPEAKEPEAKKTKAKKKKGENVQSLNLIGRKGSKMTMESNVKTLALKVYDEQIPDGWEKLCERILALPKCKYQILAIKHDRDVLGDDFFEPSTEKAHYHIIVRVMSDEQTTSKTGLHVRTILKDLGIVFRPEDATMIANHGIETVGDFGAYATYLTHDTEKAIADGKEHYNLDEIISNLTADEILMIRDGYVRVSQQARKVGPKELIETDAFLYELGRNLGDYDEWYNEQGFMLRRHTSMKTLRESYARGVESRIRENKYINRLCIFITGSQNSGKSYTSLQALKELGYKRIHPVDNEGTGKFDELSPTTQAIIIDDQKAPSLLNLCDNKITKVYRRNNGDRYFTGDMLIVTSNLTFEEWAKACGCNDKQVEPLKSRFYVCELTKEGKLKCTSVSDRGTDIQQMERLERFMKFKTIYDLKVSEYYRGDLSYFYKKLTESTTAEEYAKLKKEIEFCEVGITTQPIIHDEMYCEVGPTVKHTEKMDTTIIKALADIVNAEPDTKLIPEINKKNPEESTMWLKIPISQNILREVASYKNVNSVQINSYKQKSDTKSIKQEEEYYEDDSESQSRKSIYNELEDDYGLED